MPITVTLLGILTVANWEQFSSIMVKLIGKITDNNSLQYSNAQTPILLTESGILNEDKEQLEKEWCSKNSTFSMIYGGCKLLQIQNV